MWFDVNMGDFPKFGPITLNPPKMVGFWKFYFSHIHLIISISKSHHWPIQNFSFPRYDKICDFGPKWEISLNLSQTSKNCWILKLLPQIICMMSIRLQWGIKRYYIYFISQVISNNAFLGQIAQIRKFGTRP